jgi:ADP-ribose pyrophosphatase YjhB (NUDIX family)
MKEEKFHRHLGIYGICRNGTKLLTVRKTRGPYRNRYDLPGGSIEANESLVQALHREFDEETGMKINILGNVGTAEFIVKYDLRDSTHIQHIAIFVEVDMKDGEFTGHSASDDTSGIEWIHLESINEGNSSPLVLVAK